ncbi:Ig-like domain-containing protein [Variovorax sp. MHTC-1]|uniref:Ig-like domain-containing protein n=1 Tax=Variovorax sp. MHTC-1 TaxID=2495593 RepID=UPI00163BCF7F|nr:Ig-like domain-containing protein [Variovorax sp. MHTC-1]
MQLLKRLCEAQLPMAFIDDEDIAKCGVLAATKLIELRPRRFDCQTLMWVSAPTASWFLYRFRRPLRKRWPAATRWKKQMNNMLSLKSPARGFTALVVAFMVGCGGGGGGGLDPILGTPPVASVVGPVVTSTSPTGSNPPVSGVATNSRVVATFSKPMAAPSLNAASFTLACPAGTSTSATVSYDAATRAATLTPATALPPNTLCVATVTTAAQDTTGLALASNFVWSFRTGALADTTRPNVIVVVPAAAAGNVPTNTKITATFNEDMNPASLAGSSFVVTNTALGTPVAGNVSYSVANRTATFTPSSPATLALNSPFTATITAGATDSAGNALAGNTAVAPNSGNHVWAFTTGATADTTPPTVTLINPVSGATNVCRTQSINATFSEPMDGTTFDATTFRVTDNGVAVAGVVSYDSVSQVASFNPVGATGFSAGASLVVTIASGSAGVKDLAGNALATDRTWNFTTSAQSCAPVVDLQTVAGFGAFGGAAGVTNQGVNTIINGHLGTTAACTLMTGFHDASNVYTETPLNIGGVNGTIFCAPPAPGTTTTLAIATQARADALAAYNTLAAMPAGSDPGAGQLGGLVLLPAVYTAAGGTFAITTGDLTLDAQGNPDASWVFQSAAELTVGLPAVPRRVFLINGAKAANVFWQVGSAARIEDGSSMIGTIIAPAGVTISTAGQTLQTTLTGRAIGLTASVTMVNTTIVAP